MENPTSALGPHRAASDLAFRRKLQQMALPLAPLVQLTTGQVHPAFPQTLLNFWLLTDDQLEAMASFYHQRTPSRYTMHYPCPVTWNSALTIEEKRRKIGKFIGLRGCETPIVASQREHRRVEEWLRQQEEEAFSTVERESRAILLRSEQEIEEEARRSRLNRQQEDDVWRRKSRWF